MGWEEVLVCLVWLRTRRPEIWALESVYLKLMGGHVTSVQESWKPTTW